MPADHTAALHSNVEGALSVLYSPHASKQQRSAANEWLVSFQRDASSWQICIEVLQGPEYSDQLQTFAAHVVRLKTQTQLDALPREALPHLRDSLVQLLCSISALHIVQSLASALAALCVQWSAWEDALQLVVSHLPPSAVLATLTVLPEECSEPRYAAKSPLSGGHGDTTSIRMQVSAWNGEVQHMLGLTLSHILCGDAGMALAAQAALEAVIEQSPPPYALHIFPAISQLPLEFCKAAAEQDGGRALPCCRLFAHFCCYNEPLWASHTPEGCALRKGLLQLIEAHEVMHEQTDEPVVIPALQAWTDMTRFSDSAATLRTTGGLLEGGLQPMPLQEAEQCFSTFVTRLLHTHHQRMRHNEGNEKLNDPFLSMASEALSAACAVLGGEKFLAILQGVSTEHDGTAAVLRVALFAVNAAEAPLLDFMARSEELSDGFIVRLAVLFVRAKHAVSSITASRDLCLAVLMPLPAFAVPFMRGLCSEEDTTGLAQELLRLMLDLAGACLLEGLHRVCASEAIMCLCEAAALHDVRLPDGVVPALTGFVDLATDLEEEQYLVQSVAYCLMAPLTCCNQTAEGRGQAAQHLLHPLAVAGMWGLSPVAQLAQRQAGDDRPDLAQGVLRVVSAAPDSPHRAMLRASRCHCTAAPIGVAMALCNPGWCSHRQP
ncbi:hypothetical protein WJX73_002959 [Symbiochloris irregularis]|uniref:Transportin-3 n=1 Tax=Symbiochloris irregularis TaxID=706552 RepID=A0AAW1NZC2_9CHLO